MSSLPDIVSISETWLDNNIVLNGDIVQSHDIFRKDRNVHGGGVMLICLKSLNSIQLNGYDYEIEGIFL